MKARQFERRLVRKDTATEDEPSQAERHARVCAGRHRTAAEVKVAPVAPQPHPRTPSAVCADIKESFIKRPERRPGQEPSNQRAIDQRRTMLCNDVLRVRAAAESVRSGSDMTMRQHGQHVIKRERHITAIGLIRRPCCFHPTNPFSVVQGDRWQISCRDTVDEPQTDM